MHNLLAVLAGALLFLWPAALNGFPIVYSDTGGFLEQALMPDMGWDKPWIYGPFLTPFHAQTTLWPAIAAQALMLSAVLWLTLLAATARATDTRLRLAHVAGCTLLAAGTAAPWFASTLMPDIFAPVTVLGLYLLATSRLTPGTTALVAVITTIAIASHLAHLVLAAATLATLSILHWRVLWRQTAPILVALALLVTTNAIGNGIPTVSPYGSVFALARLVADGPARTVIQAGCPAAAWRVCRWKDNLPEDSDDFLWDPHGPVWADGYGPIRLAPEAAVIVRQTLREQPLAVLRAAARNTLTQLTEATVGDTLIPDHLDLAVRERLQTYFPPAETARFDASRQARGTLPALAAPLNPLYTLLLLVGTAATAAIALAQWRRNRPLAILAATTLAALLANAAATGALSHPHDRYQARIAWLVVLVPTLAVAQKALSLRERVG